MCISGKNTNRYSLIRIRILFENRSIKNRTHADSAAGPAADPTATQPPARPPTHSGWYSPWSCPACERGCRQTVAPEESTFQKPNQQLSRQIGRMVNRPVSLWQHVRSHWHRPRCYAQERCWCERLAVLPEMSNSLSCLFLSLCESTEVVGTHKKVPVAKECVPSRLSPTLEVNAAEWKPHLAMCVFSGWTGPPDQSRISARSVWQSRDVTAPRLIGPATRSKSQRCVGLLDWAGSNGPTAKAQPLHGGKQRNALPPVYICRPPIRCLSWTEPGSHTPGEWSVTALSAPWKAPTHLC